MAGNEQMQAAPAYHRGFWTRWRALAVAILAPVLAIAGFLAWLDTGSGHRFIARQISGLHFDSGMTLYIGRIDGSIYRAPTIHDLVVGDPGGVFAKVPEARLDWRPFTYLFGHLDIHSLDVPAAELSRWPAFKKTSSNKPLLPDLDIDIGKLSVGRVEIARAVTGERHRVTLQGKLHIADRRAVIHVEARALEGPGVAGGDRLSLDLDAVPEKNRLDLAADLAAPANGLMAALTGRHSPVTASVSGKGDWVKWDGELEARLAGDKLAELALGARNGTISVRGTTRPDLLLGGGLSMLFQPETRIDLTAALDNRRADLAGAISSSQFRLGADGIADFVSNRFDKLALDFHQLEHGATLGGLGGQNIAAKMALDGPFARPAIAYDLSASRLSLGGIAIAGLHASGEGGRRNGRLSLPLHAKAIQVTGFNPSLDQLLTNVRIDGIIALEGSRITADKLAMRSDRATAKATLAGNLADNHYQGTLDGRVGNYQLAGIGRLDIASGVNIEAGKSGFRLTGNLKVASRAIASGAVRHFLGGNGSLSARIAYGGDRELRISQLRIAAPAFQMEGGGSSLGPDGKLRFAASGDSQLYGPIKLDLGGTSSAPIAVLTASRPGVGIGLADLRAELRGTDSGYALTAGGTSAIGKLDAKVAIRSNPGPLTLDVTRLGLGGVGFAGRLGQSAAGPFSGTLDANGSGINGTVKLAPDGDYQRVTVDARASGARLRGSAGLAIGRGILAADLTFFDKPRVKADLQLANASLGGFSLQTGRAKLDYRDGTGSAKLLARGNRGGDFELAANAQLTPGTWRVALDGSAGGVAFRTENPAQIATSGAGYQLAPMRLMLRKGSVELAGRYQAGLEVRSRLSDVDLSVLRPLLPGLGIGGVASGSVDFANRDGGFPSAQARLALKDFTRTGPSSLSRPVDVDVTADLQPGGGSLKALAKHDGARLGQLRLELTPPASQKGNWLDRLGAARLGGGIRYNGSASTLFSLAALRDQRMAGNIALAADFSGTLQDPVLAGLVRADGLTYDSEKYGTRLTDMHVRGSFANDHLEVSELTAKAGDGTVSASGYVSLSSAKGYPLQLGLELDNAQVASQDAVKTSATGKLSVENTPGTPATISGSLRLPETRYRIIRQAQAEVKTLSGVHRKSDSAQGAGPAAKPGSVSGLPADWRLAIDVSADNRIFVSGMGMDSEWSADLKFRGTTGAPTINGGMTLIRGTLGFAGRNFALQPGGRLVFDNGDPSNPKLSITATGKVEDIEVSINLSGSALDPKVRFSSTPALPQDEIMARVLFGNSVANLSALQAVQLASSLNALRAKGGLNPLGVLQSATGIDRIRVLGNSETNGNGTAVGVGKYITNDVYVEVVTDARGYTATQIEVSLTRALSILSQVSSFGGSNVNLRYSKDY